MKNFYLTVLFCLLLSGCAHVTVEHEGQLTDNSQQPKTTYGWLNKLPDSDDLRVSNPEVDRLVKDSVDRQLARKGFVKVGPAEADYLVTWFGTITDEVKEISVARFYGRYGYASLIGNIPANESPKDGKVLKTYSRGTLIIDILDRNSKKVLWRGNATNSLGDIKMSTKEKKRYIERSVAKILEKLPQK